MDPQNIPPQTQLTEPVVLQPQSKFPLPIILIICVFLLLLVVGISTYYLGSKQVKTQINIISTQIPTTTINSYPTQPSFTPIPTLSNITQNTGWERYQSTIGISFLKPDNSGVREPNLSTDISIESKDNRRENQEIIDGWVIGMTYTPKQDAPTSIQKRAEEIRSEEEKNGCIITPLTTTLIGGKTTYIFFITKCFHFDSSRYFVESDSTYYEINAEYIGNVNKYKEITNKIITSIIFTK